MGFLLEASKYHQNQNQHSEIDPTIVLIILGLGLLSLFIYLIHDYIKNGPNTFPDDTRHPFVNYSYPGWKHLADQLGEEGEWIRKIRRKYYGINDTYVKPNNNKDQNKE